MAVEFSRRQAICRSAPVIAGGFLNLRTSQAAFAESWPTKERTTVAGTGGSTTSTWKLAHGNPSVVMQHTYGAEYFDIPPLQNLPTIARNDGVHYVYKRATAPLNLGQTITLRFRLDLAGVLLPTDQNERPPCKVLLFFQQRDDTLTAYEQDKRWWSSAKVELVDGTWTLHSAVDPTLWTNVFGIDGVTRASGWSRCLGLVANIGFTLSGRSFGGHGVYAESGSARFTVLEYTVG